MSRGRHMCECPQHQAELKKARVNADAQRASRRSRGLCVACGLEPPEIDAQECPTCREIKQVKKAERKGELPRQLENRGRHSATVR